MPACDSREVAATQLSKQATSAVETEMLQWKCVSLSLCSVFNDFSNVSPLQHADCCDTRTGHGKPQGVGTRLPEDQLDRADRVGTSMT